MKKGIFKFSLLAMLFASLATFNSCKKEQSDDDTSVASDNFKAENESDRIWDAINSSAYENSIYKVEDASFALLPSCAEVFLDTIPDTITGEKSITILFDTTSSQGCMCSGWDNKYRKGEIKATWTGQYRDAGTVITISTHNYYVSGDKYDYMKTVTNNGLNGAGHYTYGINVSLANILFTDGTTMSWTSQRNREWVEGQSTLTPLDDVYSITGNAEGVSRAGASFTASITDPLIIAVGCPYIKQGTIEITPDGKPVRILDFGTGSCDSQATVEINGVVFNIVLQ